MYNIKIPISFNSVNLVLETKLLINESLPMECSSSHQYIHILTIIFDMKAMLL